MRLGTGYFADAKFRHDSEHVRAETALDSVTIVLRLPWDNSDLRFSVTPTILVHEHPNVIGNLEIGYLLPPMLHARIVVNQQVMIHHVVNNSPASIRRKTLRAELLDKKERLSMWCAELLEVSCAVEALLLALPEFFNMDADSFP